MGLDRDACSPSQRRTSLGCPGVHDRDRYCAAQVFDATLLAARSRGVEQDCVRDAGVAGLAAAEL
jgi:hypothetical protein